VYPSFDFKHYDIKNFKQQGNDHAHTQDHNAKRHMLNNFNHHFTPNLFLIKFEQLIAVALVFRAISPVLVASAIPAISSQTVVHSLTTR
jgi:hypothetical protein